MRINLQTYLNVNIFFLHSTSSPIFSFSYPFCWERTSCYKKGNMDWEMNPHKAVKFDRSQLFQGKEKTPNLANWKGHNTMKEIVSSKGWRAFNLGETPLWGFFIHTWVKYSKISCFICNKVLRRTQRSCWHSLLFSRAMDCPVPQLLWQQDLWLERNNLAAPWLSILCAGQARAPALRGGQKGMYQALHLIHSFLPGYLVSWSFQIFLRLVCDKNPFLTREIFGWKVHRVENQPLSTI